VRGLLDQQGAVEQVRADVLAGGELLAQIELPRLEAVHPAADRVGIGDHLLAAKGAAPAVVDHMDHGHPGEAPLRAFAEEQLSGDLVVAVAEDVGRDRYGLADDALDGIAAFLHLREDVLYDHPLSSILHWISSPGPRP
jgi:hypothetical protein